METMKMQRKMRMPTLYERYRLKCLKILNSSLEWNYEKLPNNTSDLQLSKCNEEIEEVIEAEDYQHQIEELADVLISIGGMARFDEETAKDMFDNFILCLDKFIFMDMVDYAEQKIKILYERSYSDGYKHDSCLLN